MEIADTADKLNAPIKFAITEIAVDCVVFGYDKGHLKVLLVNDEKNKGLSRWRLPSGFMKQDESADCTAERLLDQCHIAQNIFLRQLRTYCDSNRTPMNRIITIGYYGLINMEKYRINYAKLNSTVQWRKIKEVPELIYDHNAILDQSLMQLNALVRQSPIALNLLPEKFTLLELMNLYQDILGVLSDKSNFRKKILNKKLLVPLDEKTYNNLSHRPAKLYKFDSALCENHNFKEFSFDF